MPRPDRLITDAYVKHGSVWQAAQAVGVSAATVWRHAKAAGLVPPRRKEVNHDFFEVIDCERKAYWLGMMTADGCVCPQPYTTKITLALATQDADHVRQFREDIGAEHKLSVRPAGVFATKLPRQRRIGCQGLVACCFSSVKMAADLARHGVTPRKSLTARPWQGPPELMRHFWRGVIDGDGCISSRYGKDRNGTWVISLVGSRPVVEAFAEYCRSLCSTTANVAASGSVFRFAVGGNRLAAVVAAHLYRGSVVSLKRKHDIADRVMRFMPSGVRYPRPESAAEDAS